MPRRANAPSTTPLARWLHAELERQGLTPTGGANRAGISPQTMQNILKGKPVLHETLAKIASAFSVPESDVIRAAADQLHVWGVRPSPLPRLGQVAVVDLADLRQDVTLAHVPYWIGLLLRDLDALGFGADDYRIAAQVFHDHANRKQPQGVSLQ